MSDRGKCPECGWKIDHEFSRCLHCGAKLDGKKENDISKGSIVFWGTLAVIAIIGMFTLFSGGNDGNNSKSNENKPQLSQAERQFKKQKPQVMQTISELKDVGFIKKVDRNSAKIWVNAGLWYQASGPSKENQVRLLAAYMGILFEVNHSVGITVSGYQSGQTLAEYSVFSGVEIK